MKQPNDLENSLKDKENPLCGWRFRVVHLITNGKKTATKHNPLTNKLPLFKNYFSSSVATLTCCTVDIPLSDRSNEVHISFSRCRSKRMREEMKEKCEWDPNNWVNIFRAWTIRKKT